MPVRHLGWTISPRSHQSNVDWSISASRKQQLPYDHQLFPWCYGWSNGQIDFNKTIVTQALMHWYLEFTAWQLWASLISVEKLRIIPQIKLRVDSRSTTADPNDDIFSITGSVTGTNRNGVAFTATITNTDNQKCMRLVCERRGWNCADNLPNNLDYGDVPVITRYHYR